MGLIKVYKDRSSCTGTWWWSCEVPLCANQGWEMGQPATVRSALRHLDRHHTLGFGRR